MTYKNLIDQSLSFVIKKGKFVQTNQLEYVCYQKK